jgi:hypothetical protein
MSDDDSLCGDEKRVDEIKRVCALAGCSERAGQFIREGKNISAVLKQLLNEKIAADERAKTPDEPDVDLHNRPPVAVREAASWDKAIKEVEARAEAGPVIVPVRP